VKFIDEVRIYAKAGDGGDGCVAWRREKYVDRGGPAGGDGGNGGDVILIADESAHSLLDFRYQPRLLAQDGEKGRGKTQFGSNGKDAVARVPVGTQVLDDDTKEIIADLTEPGMQAVICSGGSGGWGNARFATSTRQSPEFAKPGLPGDERNIRLSLKLMADVGLLGFPNAGKSTLLSVISAARPKIADYPFTTLIPQLGVVKAPDGNSLVVADIPGLIEGAAEGAGLGIRFLKHLERVRVLCHLIEPIPQYFSDKEKSKQEEKVSDAKLLIRRYETIRGELEKFSKKLCELPEIVAISKTDLLSDEQEQVDELKKYLKKKGVKVLLISSATKEGIDALIKKLWTIVNKL